MARDQIDLVEEAQFRADRLDEELRDATPQAILASAIAEFGSRLALVSSFGSESAVLLHMAADLKPDLPVLFLDTGMLFAQTLDYRKVLAERLGLNDVRDLRPGFEDLAIADPEADLYQRDTDACCSLRKVIPLDRALGEFNAWITGRKRFQGGARLRLPVVEASAGKIKINPLASWTKADLEAYAAEHALPQHPLVGAGFQSIGCWPCTDVTPEGGDSRAGRWAGSQKSECGIHIARAPGAAPFLGADL